jgi:hypothetical protein
LLALDVVFLPVLFACLLKLRRFPLGEFVYLSDDGIERVVATKEFVLRKPLWRGVVNIDPLAIISFFLNVYILSWLEGFKAKSRNLFSISSILTLSDWNGIDLACCDYTVERFSVSI